MKTTEVLSELKRRFPNEPEYHQAVAAAASGATAARCARGPAA